MNDSIGVLIPIYNGAQHIEALKAALQKQIRQPDAIYVYDDGSSDGTFEAARSWSEENPAVHIYRDETNRGRGHARQKLLELAETTYVAWLDADDEWHPSKLKIEEKYISENYGALPDNIILSSPYCRINTRTSGAEDVYFNKKYDSNYYLNFARESNKPFMLQSSFGSRKSFLETGFDEKLNWSEDFDFFLRFLASGGIVDSISSPIPLCYYYHSIFGRSGKSICSAHDYLYRKNHHLWPHPEAPCIEKCLRRLRYCTYALTVNGEIIKAEEELFSYIDKISEWGIQDDFRRAAKLIIKSCKDNHEDYVRISHRLANYGKRLKVERRDGAYVPLLNGDHQEKMLWKGIGPQFSESISLTGALQDSTLSNLFYEGCRELRLEAGPRKISRRFSVSTAGIKNIVLKPSRIALLEQN